MLVLAFSFSVPLLSRGLASKAAQSFITTPIFYVNAAPHIGHLYSALLADAAHRWHLLKGAEPAIFSTGTDEHGLKVQKVAATRNVPPLALCDEISGKFKELFDRADIAYTRYIRTTEQEHVKRVQQFWSMLHDRGYLYKGHYSGWYSVSDEAYLTEAQVTNGPEPGTKISLESGHPVEWSEEENYLFKLTAFREQLLTWIKTPPYPVKPKFARELVTRWLQEDFHDLSVSRPRSRLEWGIPVPNDDSQTIYVWLDALVNYLTVSGDSLADHVWPPTAHVVGKDILRFHAIYWPAFLLAAGFELPKKIISHSHWLVDKTKMSKSRGNVVDPLEQFSFFGVEYVRYFLLREGHLHHDGSYSTERLVNVVNSDLANTLGNTLQRISSKKLHVGGPGLKYHKELFPLTSDPLINSLQNLPGFVENCYESFYFSRGIEGIMRCLHMTNRFIDEWAPWHMTKDPSAHPSLETILLITRESLRLAGVLLYPIIPELASGLLCRLGFAASPTVKDLECKLTDTGLDSLEESSKHLQLLTDGSRPLFTKVALPNDGK